MYIFGFNREKLTSRKTQRKDNEVGGLKGKKGSSSGASLWVWPLINYYCCHTFLTPLLSG